MRDIKHAETVITAHLKEKIEKLKEAQRETAKKIWEDVVSNAPLRSGDYIASIKLGETEQNKNVITTIVYSDLMVGGDNPKWAKVPLGCLLEWGTGVKGAGTNTFEHGYGYRLTSWTYYDKYLHTFITTDGMVARPHFFPSLQNNVALYKENIKRALGDD